MARCKNKKKASIAVVIAHVAGTVQKEAARRLIEKSLGVHTRAQERLSRGISALGVVNARV